MLMPSKVKYRKQQRGRRSGKAHKGCHISFGDYGLKSMESASICRAVALRRRLSASANGAGSSANFSPYLPRVARYCWTG